MSSTRVWTASRWITGAAIITVPVVISAVTAAATQAPNRIALNQSDAISTLRTIAAAQTAFKAAVDLDTNCDGVGEYGYFAELAGRVPMRVGVGIPCTPAAGTPGIDELNPPLLRSSFGTVIGSRVLHHGYLFQMWLPAPTAGGITGAFSEDFTGGKAAAPFPDSMNGERLWCCYAWPLSYNHTGRRAYFINQRGVVLEWQNRTSTPFSGTANPPRFDDAFVTAGDMASPLRIGLVGGLGTIWWPVP